MVNKQEAFDIYLSKDKRKIYVLNSKEQHIFENKDHTKIETYSDLLNIIYIKTEKFEEQ